MPLRAMLGLSEAARQCGKRWQVGVSHRVNAEENARIPQVLTTRLEIDRQHCCAGVRAAATIRQPDGREYQRVNQQSR